MASFIKDDFSFIQQKKITENLNHIFKKKLNLVPFNNEFNLKEFKLINNIFDSNSDFTLQNLFKEQYIDISNAGTDSDGHEDDDGNQF